MASRIVQIGKAFAKRKGYTFVDIADYMVWAYQEAAIQLAELMSSLAQSSRDLPTRCR